MSGEIVVMGVSAGGLEAVSAILRGLPEDFDFPLVVVQHRSPDSTLLCDVLQRFTPAPVTEAMDKEEIESGHVYLAPADYHLLIDGGHFALSTDAPEFYSRPSIDMTFESVADEYRKRVIGVVLTGANRDGARGLRRIVDRGGRALVQDPSTAEVPVMPLAAIAEVPEADVVPLQGIARRIHALSRGGTGERTAR